MIDRGRHGADALGAAHTDPRDAYRDVPILKAPTWNNEIAAYFYLGGISGGASVVAALAELFGGPPLRRLARVAHWVALLTLLPCPPLLISDLGSPSRFHHMLRVFKPGSPMNVGSWILTAHGALVAVGSLRTSRIPVLGALLHCIPAQPVAVAELPLGVGLAGYTGVLLGTTSVPVWSASPFLGGLFTASAMSTGAAAVSLAASVTRESTSEREALSRISIGSGLVELVVLGAYLATSGRAARPLLEGSSMAVTLGGAAATASAVALEALAARLPIAGRWLTQLAALCTLAGGIALRFSLVRAGRASANDREETLRTAAPSQQSPGWTPEHPGA
jgi:formate-dependent nitrite reductase membrane component NrfD